jgi:hypothetical protein
MGWTFVYLMLVLKIPIAALLYIVWWAIRSEPQQTEPAPDGGGGTKTPVAPRHPRGPLPRHPRRGPHGDPLPIPPPRTRGVVARARADRA